MLNLTSLSSQPASFANSLMSVPHSNFRNRTGLLSPQCLLSLAGKNMRYPQISMPSVCQSELLNPKSHPGLLGQRISLSTWLLYVRALCVWSGSQRLYPSPSGQGPIHSRLKGKREDMRALWTQDLQMSICPLSLFRELQNSFTSSLMLAFLIFAFSSPASFLLSSQSLSFYTLKNLNLKSQIFFFTQLSLLEIHISSPLFFFIFFTAFFRSIKNIIYQHVQCLPANIFHGKKNFVCIAHAVYPGTRQSLALSRYLVIVE